MLAWVFTDTKRLRYVLWRCLIKLAMLFHFLFHQPPGAEAFAEALGFPAPPQPEPEETGNAQLNNTKGFD